MFYKYLKKIDFQQLLLPKCSYYLLSYQYVLFLEENNLMITYVTRKGQPPVFGTVLPCF